jgi:hypothetical protein
VIPRTILRCVAIAAAASVLPAHGAVIDFQNIAMTPDQGGLFFSAAGVSGHVEGYHVEFANGTGATTVYGPVTTAEVPVVSASFDYYGFGRVTAAGAGTPLTGLGMLSYYPMGQTDPDLCCATFNPGFDNSTLGTVPVGTLQFALFRFDTAVDLSAVIVNRNGNTDRSIWLAGGTTAPDFSGGLGAAFATYSIVNSRDLASGGLLTHAVDLKNITYLMIGTPPPMANAELGALNAVPGVEFYLQGIDVAPVPLPAALPLLSSGIGLLTALGYRRRRYSGRVSS